MTSMSRPFGFILPTSIEFGAGCRGKLPDLLGGLGIKKPLIVTDRGLRALPWFAELVSRVGEAGFRIEIFDEVEANPKDYNVAAAADAARAFGADGIVAIGGGSPIDCSKAAAVLARQGGKPRDYEDRSKIGADVLPLVAVPTTAGTGSEVTFSSVITDSKAKFKFTVKSPRMAPRIALADPELGISLPPSLTAATGMDALTHAIEAYTSRAAEPLADACALYAAELIARSLPKAVKAGGDLEARSAMLLGSLIAGIAFSHSDVGAVHCLAEALGGMYDVPHGVCNAVCLPAVMDFCREECSDRYARLGAAMGTEASSEAAVEFVRNLAIEVGLPEFRSFGVPAKDFPVIAEKSSVNGSNMDNIPTLSKENYLELLERLSK